MTNKIITRFVCPTIVTNWNGTREPESTGSALRKVRAAIEALERTRKDAA